MAALDNSSWAQGMPQKLCLYNSSILQRGNADTKSEPGCKWQSSVGVLGRKVLLMSGCWSCEHAMKGQVCWKCRCLTKDLGPLQDTGFKISKIYFFKGFSYYYMSASNLRSQSRLLLLYESWELNPLPAKPWLQPRISLVFAAKERCMAYLLANPSSVSVWVHKASPFNSPFNSC